LLPESPRAWTQLGGAHFDLYKATEDAVHLVRAVEVNEKGLEKVTSVSMASNIVIYKSLLGTVTDADWLRFMEVLKQAPPGWQNKLVVWTLMNNVDRGFNVEAQRVVEVFGILRSKAKLRDNEVLKVAVFIYKYGKKNDSLPYFIEFAERVDHDSPDLIRIIGELEEAGHSEWAALMREMQGKKNTGRG